MTIESTVRQLQLDAGIVRPIWLTDMLEQWSGFVAQCEDGYAFGTDEYDNDLTVRRIIELVLAEQAIADDPGVAHLREMVALLDARFRSLLQPGVARMSTGPWWRQGVLRGAGDEYVDDMQRRYRITVERC